MATAATIAHPAPGPREAHVLERVGWLRAAVLGANDGVLSVASIIVGVASASSDARQILLAGLAGWVAGAMSMAAGEYVSVSSQADAEQAELAREAAELEADPHAEQRELAAIYMKRGLDKATAREVARQLHDHDALAAHARDELGITEISTANPIQAAFASALAFTVGAVLPLLVALIVPKAALVWAVFGVTLLVLATLGAVGAKAGGAAMRPAAIRVLFWGALAMAVTAGVGKLVGTTV